MTSITDAENVGLTTGWVQDLKSKLEAKGEWQTFLDKLADCKTNVDRVQTVTQLDFIDTIVQVDTPVFAKDDKEAVKFREAGNSLFQSREYILALKQYNRSVMLAATTGDTMALSYAFANRSAVLFHIKLYQNCLLDVAAAVQYGYPEKLRFKLFERQGKCHYHLGETAQAEEAFNAAKQALHISELDNNKINNMINDFEKQVNICQKEPSTPAPSAKNVLLHGPLPKLDGYGTENVLTINHGLTLGYDKYSGRGLYANRDIEVGEVLIVEKPYATTVLSTLKQTYCHHCCSRVISPVPCLACSGCLFCSDQCRTEAWDGYHRFECTVLHKVSRAGISLGHLALKTVFTAGPKMLAKLTERDGDQALTGFPLDKGYDSTQYESVYKLVNHAEDRTAVDLLKYTVQAYFLMKCVKETSFLGDEKGIAEQGQVTVGAHLLRNLMMMPCNAHECSELVYKEGNLPESMTAEVGSAIYPCLSLINHSCDPSVVRHSYKNLCVVRAIRNISKGTEVLDNYGSLAALTPVPERRTKLESQYYFTCHCLACEDDTPQYQDLPTDTPVFKCDKCAGPIFMPIKGGYDDVPCSFCKHSHDLTRRLGTLAESDELYRVAMMQVLTSSCKNIDENIKSLEQHLRLMDRLLCRPWRDFNDCQEALKQCYAVKANTISSKMA